MKIGHVDNPSAGWAHRGYCRPMAEQSVAIPMAPLLSVAFLLIVFFLLSLRLCPPEGDLAKEAAASSRPVVDARQLPIVKVRLKADERGGLASISMDRRPLKDLEELRTEIREMALAAGGSPEIELDCDYQLGYEHTMRAITSVSGYSAEDGRTPVKLVDRVKFAPRRKP